MILGELRDSLSTSTTSSVCNNWRRSGWLGRWPAWVKALWVTPTVSYLGSTQARRGPNRLPDTFVGSWQMGFPTPLPFSSTSPSPPNLFWRWQPRWTAPIIGASKFLRSTCRLHVARPFASLPPGYSIRLAAKYNPAPFTPYRNPHIPKAKIISHLPSPLSLPSQPT